MASAAGNPNQPPPGAFDMQKFFRPPPPPSSSNPSSNNYPNALPPPPPPSTSSSYPPPSSTVPFSYPPSHHQHQMQQHHFINNNIPHPYPPAPPPPPQDHLQLPLQHPQRTISYPTPPFQHLHQQPPAPPNHNHGARLMALLGTAPSPASNLLLDSSSSSPSPPVPSAPPATTPPTRLMSTKLPRGRRLTGNHLLYDVDVRLPGEYQPQLEVTPITKYVSDPGLVLGRQIAVNKSYICYGLKLGAIRILNINTALRALIRAHTQRVSDMAFFAEDVHFLASASIDGRVYVWKINEGPDADDKPQITGKVVVAVQMVGEGESIHPRVCWHSHKQEFLVVAIGNRVLKIDTTKVGKGEGFSAEEPLKCSLEKLIDGIQLVGKHDGEVTDLSMCQWMTTRLVSASSDGTVKIWDDRKSSPLAVLRPHDGQPVNSATFLTASHNPEHIILVTAGPLNREVKIWTSESEDGWLLPSDADSWKCTQTLELKSSAESQAEEAFFNQVVALPRAGIILLANAKKNAIYAVHIEYGPCPAATHMDYIAEFTVTMPILSLTGTSESLPDGNHIVQVYCVQTQAIQQYALDLSQCLPPPIESIGLEKGDSNAIRTFETSSSNGFTVLEASQGSGTSDLTVGSATHGHHTVSSSESAPVGKYPIIPGVPEVPSLHNSNISESKQNILPTTVSDVDITRVPSPSAPSSPMLSGRSSGFRSPSNTFEPSSPLGIHAVDQPVNYSVDGRGEAVNTTFSEVSSFDDNSRKAGNNLQNEISTVPNSNSVFKQPTHLITPSEILSMTVSSSSENTQGLSGSEVKVQDVVVNTDVENVEAEVKVIGASGTCQDDEFESQRESDSLVTERREKSFYSQASDLNIEMARESCALSTESLNIEDGKVDNSSVIEASERPSNAGAEVFQDTLKDLPAKVSEATSTTMVQTPVGTKTKKPKGKHSQVSGSSSPSPFNSMDSSNEPSNSTADMDASFQALQEALNKIMATQKEMQKQMATIVAAPIAKEGKRVEAAIGRSMEKTIKAHTDALWARFQEENTKHDKLDRTQQIMSSITSSVNKEVPPMLERSLKKELAVVGQAVSRAVEKSISSAITESFQRGVGDKAVNQLEKSVNSKLEATVARQIQAQFQTSGKQALQDVVKSNLETCLIPAFEASCKTMFEQIDAAFQKGMSEYTASAQQQLDSAQSPLALTLREALDSVTSINTSLSGEIADGQRKLLALATSNSIISSSSSSLKDPSAASSSTNNPLSSTTNSSTTSLHEMQHQEVVVDPRKELSRLISQAKYEEAFTAALQRSDVSIVSWLCSQVDLQAILSSTPPLSQGVLLALLQQLACDISTDTPLKLAWMTHVAVTINPTDPMIAMHTRPIFEQVYQILGHQPPTTNAAQASSTRLLMHVINSMLISCK